MRAGTAEVLRERRGLISPLCTSLAARSVDCQILHIDVVHCSLEQVTRLFLRPVSLDIA
jgi:hypothetical protein